MKKRTITLFTAIAAAIAFASTAQAAPITAPTDGYTGDYRIALITSSRTTADANNPISFYNGIVTTAAAAVPELNALGTTWTAIASTIAVDARDNTGTNPSSTGIPIYTTNGVRVANNNADLWDGTLAQRLYYDDGTTDVDGFGGTHGFYDSSWTGTKTDGTQDGDGTTNPQDGNALSTGPATGGNNITVNYNPNTAGGWIDAATGSGEDSRGRHLLGISGVISGGTPPAASTAAITSITRAGTTATIDMTGSDSVTTYTCDSSPDLVNWTLDVATTPASLTTVSGVLSFTVDSTPVKKFYRIAE